MGKKRRLNKFISKWIKSDLPEDRTTVLLLGVTRIPTSPAASRRPFSAAAGAPIVRRNSSRVADKRGGVVRRSSSKKAEGRDRTQVPTPSSSYPLGFHATAAPPSGRADKCADGCGPDHEGQTGGVTDIEGAMEKSADSIGACSLDVERSAELSPDLTDISSTITLRSCDVSTPPAPPQPQPHPLPHHLPSYLSLACAVNGYSTSTHYDPSRLLSRSRDVSPHRIDGEHHLTVDKGCSTHCPKDTNLLSPPNLVPLPIMEKAIALNRPGEFYSSMKSSKFISKESFTAGLFSGVTKDTTDGCLENGHHTIHNKCVSFESKSITNFNGTTKCVSETAMKQEYTNGSETKSFIQQRVERLYGPGALAQGFFVTTRCPSKKRLSESEDASKLQPTDRHSKSMQERLLEDPPEPAMRQSTSSPTLPVLRHLRPEFRAQLPLVGAAKRAGDAGGLAKSVTVPALQRDAKANGEAGEETAGAVAQIARSDGVEKDGHYFLLILEDQTKRLLELAARVENDMLTPDLSEDLIGKLRSTSGKARLLVNQKMQQFRGLCTNNINRSVGEAFPTTNEDLQGFWDMVMLQVRQVDALFEEVDELRANGWKEVPKVRAKATNGAGRPRKIAPPKVKPVSAASEEAKRQREAQRKKMIEDRRKAMRENKPKESIEIFVQETS